MKRIILFLVIIMPQLIFSQWFIVNNVANSQFYSVCFTSNTVGYIGGNQNGVIFKTADGGSNFTSATTGTNIWFIDIYFINPQTGFACGQNGYIVKTTNAGLNWNPVFQAANFMHCIRFVDANTGYCAGYTYVYKTTNGGNSWNLSTNQYSNYLLGTSFINSNTGFICGGGGLIARTTNGGSSWEAIFSGVSEQLEEIVMANANTGYVVGYFGKILKTTNGGSNWNQQTSGTTEPLIDLFMMNSNTGWACGFNGKIVYTSNGGSNWFLQNVPAVSIIRQIHFLTPDTGYAVTDNGLVLKTYTGGNVIGIHQTGTEIPKDFSLSQNYPNPFNPSTNIKFSVPKSSYVTLNIYDNLGKKISTLVNQDINAGNYEVNFDAGELSSGIYYYRIFAGDYMETKKMILVR